MKIGNQRSSLIKGLEKIALKHLLGLLGIAIVAAVFFTAAKCISFSGHTLIDMRGFQLVEHLSDGTGRHLVSDPMTSTGLAESYYLTDGEKLSLDLANWTIAENAWTAQIKGINAYSKDNSTITFDLLASDAQYYIYTFPGSFASPPQGWDNFFQDFNTGNSLRFEFDYTLLNNLDSLGLFFQQYDDKQRIDSKSWNIPNKKGNNTFTESVDIRSEAKSFRVYLRFINRTQNTITLESLKLYGYTSLLTKIENNFKKLSFDLNLSGISRDPGFVIFKKGLDLKARGDYRNLYFFISGETGELDKALLSSFRIKAFLDEALVWSMPVSEIGKPTFVEQNLNFINHKDLHEISFQVVCDLLDSAVQKEIRDQSFHIAIEYLDIR
jgi:hypothetical protein